MLKVCRSQRSDEDSKLKSKSNKATKAATKAMANAQTVDLLHSKDSKQRKKLCRFCIGSSTGEINM
jgi:hypothetical protein